MRLSIRNSAAVLQAVSITSNALAQSDADDASKSNNPLDLAASFNIQDYYVRSVHGASAHTNDFLLRPTMPLGPNGIVPVPQIFGPASI
ncbi:hypothetical protein [Streptomyces rochei]|uniref:hypothetical protein n=1 Tax=Streptomyces rochei TaxID=1928 RepID=UPI0022E9ACF6|nr:hypothetical protein [Streptomyces rochei]MCC8455805.1 hypothetical protein [Streptomyces rochei]